MSYSHEWGVHWQFFSRAPWGGVKTVKYHLILITNSISMIFIPNFVCVLINERYKTYQTRFSFCRLGHVSACGHWGCSGGQTFSFFHTCGISNQRGWRTEQSASKRFILGSNWWPWGVVKGQISLNFGYHVNFKDVYQTVCVFSQLKDRNILNRISILMLGSCPSGGAWGCWGFAMAPHRQRILVINVIIYI